jgi:hypothetical protein
MFLDFRLKFILLSGFLRKLVLKIFCKGIKVNHYSLFLGIVRRDIFLVIIDHRWNWPLCSLGFNHHSTSELIPHISWLWSWPLKSQLLTAISVSFLNLDFFRDIIIWRLSSRFQETYRLFTWEVLKCLFANDCRFIVLNSLHSSVILLILGWLLKSRFKMGLKRV